MDSFRWRHGLGWLAVYPRGELSFGRALPRAAHDPGAGWRPIRIQGVEHARRLVGAGWDQVPPSRHLLAREGCLDVARLTDGQVMDRLAWKLAWGEWVLLERDDWQRLGAASSSAGASAGALSTAGAAARSRPTHTSAPTTPSALRAGAVGAPPPNLRAAPPAMPQRPRPEVAYWVEIELVGEDDQPIPGEAYLLALPDGRLMSGNLDGSGFARFDDLQAGGDCKVSFPRLDRDAWEKVAALSAR